MNYQLHQKHGTHLQHLRSQIQMADNMLGKHNYLDADRQEAVSQSKAIMQMQLEYGAKAFSKRF